MRVKITSFMLFLAIFFSAGYGFAEPIAVIVNKTNPTEELSLSELQLIYESKKTQWPDKKKNIPINREYVSGIRQAFSRAVHNKLPEEMNTYWYRMAYEGTRPPMTQESTLAVMRYVANMPGVIGYVYLSEVDITVKTIKINGLAPSQEGYEIKD